MKIKTILTQHRRDFTALYQCESCGHEQTGTGYDDSYFHCQVIPAMKCKKCEKTSPQDYRPLMPKYADSQTV